MGSQLIYRRYFLYVLRYVFLLILTVLSSYAWSVSYMTEEEALRWALPDADDIKPQRHILDLERKRVLEKQAGWQLKDNAFTFYEGQRQGKVVGYAFLDDEIGKHQPITFVVALTSDGKIRDVDVVIYRESVGEGIKGRHFLDQFRGKDVSSRLRLGDDVDSITGATLSARASTRVVKKALILFQEFYGDRKGTL